MMQWAMPINILLVPVLEVIFGFIAWLIGDSEPSKRDPTILKLAMSLSLLKFVGQASLVDDAMLPS